MGWTDKEYEKQWRFAYYRSHKAMIDARSKQGDRDRIERYKKWKVEYFKTHPCIDCGFTDPRALDFDHVIGQKTMSVSRMKKHSMKRILQEVEKCVVRCANCHRIVTDKRLRGTSEADYKPHKLVDVGASPTPAIKLREASLPVERA